MNGVKRNGIQDTNAHFRFQVSGGRNVKPKTYDKEFKLYSLDLTNGEAREA